MWNKNDNISGHLYCKIAMVHYLMKDRIVIERNTFANDICWPCWYFLVAFTTSPYRAFHFSSFSNQLCDDWLTPSAAGCEGSDWEKPCLAEMYKIARRDCGNFLNDRLR